MLSTDSLNNSERTQKGGEDNSHHLFVMCRDSIAKPRDSIAKPRDSIAKPRDSIAKPRDSIARGLGGGNPRPKAEG